MSSNWFSGHTVRLGRSAVTLLMNRDSIITSLDQCRDLYIRSINNNVDTNGLSTIQTLSNSDIWLLHNSYVARYNNQCDTYCHLLVHIWHQATCSHIYDVGRWLIQTSYRQISWSLEAARLDDIMIVSLWNLTGISTAIAMLSRCLSNFRAIGRV